MVVERKPLHKMNQEATAYLAENTPFTYLNDGGMAAGIVKAANRQIADLQNLTTTLFANSRLSTASGIFLDMIGEMLGVVRLPATAAVVDKSEGIIRFYVESGALGTYLPHPTDPKKGFIPRDTEISNPTASIVLRTTEDTEFPRGVKSVYVSASSTVNNVGTIGVGILTTHSLGNSSVKVRNDSSIATSRDFEDDDTYRFRISNAVFSLAGGNRTAVQTSVLSFPGIQSVSITEYARGTGSFDVFVVPVHSRLGEALRRRVDQAVQRTKALGISAKIREPEYVPIAVSVQLTFDSTAEEALKIGTRDAAKQAVRDYLETIPLGGEIIINQLRSVILTSAPGVIKDLRILELCFRGRPQIIRNIRLAGDELLVLDDSRLDPIEVL